MQRALILLMLLLSLRLSGQHSSYIQRSLADSIPQRYQVDVPALRTELLKRIPAAYCTDERAERRNFRYADQRAYAISRRLRSGYVYSDWPELEAHVNEVLQRVVPKDMPFSHLVHAYVVRESEYNAYMTGAGYLFVTLGLLNETRDEASLAAVLCHELAHFHLQHDFISYHHVSTGAYGPGLPGELKSHEHSVRMELQADSLALEWLLASDYHIGGMYEQLSAMARIKKVEDRMLGDHKDRRPKTHPGVDERLNAFAKFHERHSEEGGSRFLVDEVAFIKLHHACRPELLRVMLQERAYDACIRQAFKYHLFEPDEPLHIWYLMEAMRRMCYLYPAQWNRLFIMDRFHAEEPPAGKQYVEKTVDHLFKKFDMDVMAMDPAIIRQIQARFYWEGEPRFTTYREAYDFYSSGSRVVGCHECLLSMALTNNRDTLRRNDLLREYLQGDAQYAGLASDLLANRTGTGQQRGKLLVFYGMEAFVKQGKDRIPVRVEGGANAQQLARLIDTLGTLLPERRLLLLEREHDRSIERHLRFKELASLFIRGAFARSDRAELYLADPRYYEVLRSEGVDDIEFVYCSYGELRKQERTADAYEEATLDYKTVFDQTEGSRFLTVYVASMRELPDGPLKVNYKSDEYSMRNGKTGLQETVLEIKRALVSKEERARLELMNRR